jgi:Helix-turn-helix
MPLVYPPHALRSQGAWKACCGCRTSPALRFLPHIITLLGFDPSAPGASLGERLTAWRHRAVVPQDRFARIIGIDPVTLSRWERNLRIPTGQYARRAEAFLEKTAV